ncbi:MAG TPA: threonine synthase [Nitriliruptorales bacterium]|nr:threonine synthase [Nitriliruptorales bacterium]
MTTVTTAPQLTTNVVGLRCRECGTEEELGAHHACGFCFGPLEVVYDETLVAARASRGAIAAGPANLWRYAPLLPALRDGPVPDDLGTGFTRLVAAPRLAARLGLGELWLKDDTRNPSGSFKDRVVSVALQAAHALGIGTLACASTGNLANAVAAHAARAGMPAYVFVPDDLEQAKIVTSAVYGANLVAVRGTYDDVNRLCAEVADARGWGFVNVNLRPYYAEGSKTLGFEIAEQLGWRLPDHVVVPVASGAQLTKVHKAFEELVRYGLVDDHPVRISGAQPAGCNPVAAAYAAGVDDVLPVKPETIAKSLAIGNPADGYYALRAVRQTGGAVADVTDDEIRAGMRLLAETEGIFAETAGGVTIATLRKLAREGVVRADERVVALVTGNGLKTVESLIGHVGPTVAIPPSLEAFERALPATAGGAA